MIRPRGRRAALPAWSGRHGAACVVPRAGAAARVLVVVLALALPSCTDGLRADQAGTLETGAGVEVTDGSGWKALEAGAAVPEGARVRTADAEARLELATGQLWLSPNAAAVVTREQVDLVRGEALVSSAGTLTTRWTDVVVRGRGIYRLTPGLGSRLAVYAGEVQVARPAEERTVSGLQQLALSERRLAAEPDPLAYRPDDTWDRQLLASAIAFDAEASRLARGIDREYDTQPRAPEFYAAFAAVDEATLPLLASTARVREGELFGPPSDALLTLFVSQAAAISNDQPVEPLARRVADLRTDGARWGLVAESLEIGTGELARAVDLGAARRVTLVPDVPPPPAAALLPTDRAAGAAASGSADVTRSADVPGPATSRQPARQPAADPRSPAPPQPRTGQPTPPPESAPPPQSSPAPLPPAPSPSPAPPPERPPELPTGPGIVERTINSVLDTVDSALDLG